MRYSGIRKFILEHVDTSLNYNERGILSHESERLYKLSVDEGHVFKMGSFRASVSIVLRELGVVKSQPKLTISLDTRIEQIEQMITEAISALQLIKGELPKIRQTVEKELREKLISTLTE